MGRGESLPIIGTDTFGLTEGEVLKARQEIEAYIRGGEEILNNPDQCTEIVRKTMQQSLQRARAKLKVLSAPPSQVVARVRTFYDRIVALGGTELDNKAVALQLRNEFSDLMLYYPLFRMQSWGYRLGQEVERHGSFQMEEH